MTAGPACRWQAVDPDKLEWASWGDGEHFLFNPASGQTHLLNDLGRALLDDLARQPANAAELAGQLYHPDHGLPVPAFTELVAEQLRQLAVMQLVEPSP